MGTLVTSQGRRVLVDDAVALQLLSIIRQIRTTKEVHLPHTSDRITSLVIEYCQYMLGRSKSMGVEFIAKLDDVTLFNLIQAAHHLKVKSLMNQTCQILVDRVDKNSSSAIMQVVQAPKRLKRDLGSESSGRLRSHRREAFIDISDGMDLHDFCFDLSKERKAEFCKTQDPEAAGCVAEFLEFSNFVMEDCSQINSLFSKLALDIRSSYYFPPKLDPFVTTAIENLHTVIGNIENLSRDLGLADLLSSEDVALRLVMILDKIDLFDIKCMAARTLSHLSIDKCGNFIEKAVPVLLKAICSDIPQVADAAASTLAHLAFKSSKDIKVTHFPAVEKALLKCPSGLGAISLSMFMVFVCRGNVLSSAEVKVVLPILEYMIACKSLSVRACYALSYLTYATDVAVKKATCERLMAFTSGGSSQIAGSALGVVGNIVRRGSPQQIQWLVKDFKLLECLGQTVLRSSFKKFRMEGCRIISNIVARTEIQISVKDMDEAGLSHLLFKILLDADEFDVKMEAAWAVFNMHYNVKYKHEDIDNYEKEINLEVEQERSGFTTGDNEVKKGKLLHTMKLRKKEKLQC